MWIKLRKEHPPVRDFLLMKNGNEIPDDSKTHYMSIEGRDSDYQVRNREQIPLDTIGVVMGKEKRKTQAQTGQGSHGNGYKNGARIILMEIRIQEAENIKTVAMRPRLWPACLQE